MAVIGGVALLLGVLLPWLSFRSCETIGAFFPLCLPYAPPGSFSAGSYGALLPIAAPLALLIGAVAAFLVFLNKPNMAVLSCVLSLAVAVVAMAFLATAGPVLDTMSADLTAMNTLGRDVTVSIGPGPYAAVVGAVLLLLAGLIDWKLVKDMEAKKAEKGAAAGASAPAGQAAQQGAPQAAAQGHTPQAPPPPGTPPPGGP